MATMLLGLYLRDGVRMVVCWLVVGSLVGVNVGGRGSGRDEREKASGESSDGE